MAGTKETKVQLQFEAKSKGFEETQRKAKKLSDELSPEKLSKGFQRMEHFLGRVERQIRGTERHFKSLNQSLAKFNQSIVGIQKMAGAMDKVARSAERADKSVERMSRRGAFTQGLAQGLGFGPFLQRGPGMTRQAAGMAVGGMGRSIFAGVGGLAQGISNIPGIGLMAGPLQAAMQGSQDWLEVQRMQVLLGGGVSMRGAKAAGQRARARVLAQPIAPMERVFPEFYGRAASDLTSAEMDVRRRVQEATPGLKGSRLKRQIQIGARPRKIGPGRFEMVPITQETAEFTAASKALVGFGEKSRSERAKSEERAVRDRALFGMPLFGGARSMQGIGERFGVAIPEAMQTMLQMKGAGGVAPSARMFETTLAAGRFGVDPATAAMFTKAQRQGGLVTNQTKAPDMMVDAFAQAVRMGLEQSEIAPWIEKTAQGIEQFQTTGIPFSGDSISRLSLLLSKTSGMMPGRAGVIAQSLVSRVQGVSAAGGPTSGLEYLMLQQFGGFKGGGPEAYLSALEKMRTADLSPEAITEFLTQATGARQRSTGTVALQLRKILGVMPESELLATAETLQGRGGPVSEAVQARLRSAAGQEEATKNVDNFVKESIRSQNNMAPNVQRDARIKNTRMLESGKMIGAMQTLEESQNLLIKGVAAFATEAQAAAGVMKSVSGLISALGDAIAHAIGNKSSVVDN